MLHRSLGAASFAGFWRYWNPIFGYGLARWVHGPLLRIVARPLAVVLTFVVCGALHDLVTAAVRGSGAFLFTPWFLVLGLGVVAGEAVGMDLSKRPWWQRASANLLYLGGGLAIVLWVKGIVRGSA